MVKILAGLNMNEAESGAVTSHAPRVSTKFTQQLLILNGNMK